MFTEDTEYQAFRKTYAHSNARANLSFAIRQRLALLAALRNEQQVHGAEKSISIMDY